MKCIVRKFESTAADAAVLREVGKARIDSKVSKAFGVFELEIKLKWVGKQGPRQATDVSSVSLGTCLIILVGRRDGLVDTILMLKLGWLG